MDNNEFKDKSSTCIGKINHKSSYYFIYALLYIETFREKLLCMKSLYRSINWNWVWCGISTIQRSKKVLCYKCWIIYIYFVHMHPIDHSEKDMCYLSSIIHITTEWHICSDYTSRHVNPYHKYFSVVIYSMFVSYLYGLMQRLLYLIVFAPYCDVTVPFVQHFFITNFPLYIFLYFYAVWLLSIILSPTL